ncbi:HNH endonuclease [Gordonia phage Kabocha]|uniref:HNH endonuclease n=1 Tax=Gordonia phage Chidiebere TaxID=2656530 RepID=A0A649VKZ1_9CAUD|nr:HNH endonuclease [Gordonia phage Chidiebere]QGJ93008.1 HNH endonuclease [Gordonia phage Chidiebere]WAA19909.1 HNH endonuclease [Gordonia phage Kabocha]WNM67141.1 HNH endonuclease [Gordonia Phage Schomber]
MDDTKCQVAGCSKPIFNKGRGWCAMHYNRHRRGVPFDKPEQVRGLSLPDRFWQYVKRGRKSECWEWQGHRTDAGYGQFVMYPPDVSQKRTVVASRQAFALSHGREAVHDVCHTCDNPPCCNPAHLYDGTKSQNSLDMVSRGRDNWATGKMKARNLRGTKNGQSKLTEADVREIRKLYAQGGYTQQALAKQFGVAQSKVSDVINRRTWKHVEDSEPVLQRKRKPRNRRRTRVQ